MLLLEHWQPSLFSGRVLLFFLVGVNVEVLQYFTPLSDLSLCDCSTAFSTSLHSDMSLLGVPKEWLSKPNGPSADTMRENSVAWTADDAVVVVSIGACGRKKSLQSLIWLGRCRLEAFNFYIGIIHIHQEHILTCVNSDLVFFNCVSAAHV